MDCPIIFILFKFIRKLKSSCLILYFGCFANICQDTTIYIENVTIHCIRSI